jgi:myo-inositol-1(or 4)-monophosphatase
MDNNSLKKYLAVAQDAARRAGFWLKEHYGEIKEMRLKESNHYTINEDKERNDFYEAILRKETPEAGLYTEEGERSLDADLAWVVDPIDGTSNYRAGVPLFMTQICLLCKNEPVLSVLFNPVLGEEFTAIKNGGAFLNGNRIEVSGETDLKRSMFIAAKAWDAESAGKYISYFGKYIRTARMFGGCTAIDLAFVASGRGEFTINSGSYLYDYAPGVLLVREAGGLVMNFEGKPWGVKDRNLVACNKELMPEVLRAMSVYQDKK